MSLKRQAFLKDSRLTPASAFHLKGDTPSLLTKELEWVCVDETCSLDAITAAFLYICAMRLIYQDKQRRCLIVLPKSFAAFKHSGSAKIFKSFADDYIALEDAFACADTHRHELCAPKSFGTTKATYINYSVQACARSQPAWSFLTATAVRTHKRFDKTGIHPSASDTKVAPDFTLPSSSAFTVSSPALTVATIRIAAFDKALTLFKESPKTHSDFYTKLKSFAITSTIYRYIQDFGGEPILVEVFRAAPFLPRLIDLVICLQTGWGAHMECNDYAVQSHVHGKFWCLAWTYERESIYKAALQGIAMCDNELPEEKHATSLDLSAHLVFDCNHTTLHVPWHTKHTAALPVFVQTLSESYESVDKKYYLPTCTHLGYGIVSGMDAFAEVIVFACNAEYEGVNPRRAFLFRYEDRHGIDKDTHAMVERVLQALAKHPHVDASSVTDATPDRERLVVRWLVSREYGVEELGATGGCHGPWMILEGLLAMVYEAFMSVRPKTAKG